MFIPEFLPNCTPVSLHMLKYNCAHTLSCLFMYCSFAGIGHADIMWSTVSSNCWQSLHLLSVSVFIIIIIIIIIITCRRGGGTVRMSIRSGQQEAEYQANGRIASRALLI